MRFAAGISFCLLPVILWVDQVASLQSSSLPAAPSLEAPEGLQGGLDGPFEGPPDGQDGPFEGPPDGQDGPFEGPVSASDQVHSRPRKWSWSWARSTTPRLTDGGGIISIPAKMMKGRRMMKSAGAILSAPGSVVAFDEDSREGVNSKWYAARGWGWRHPDNWKERNYICMYSMEGRHCGPNASWSSMWPRDLHCYGTQCCSKVHTGLFFSAPLCTSNSALCVITHSNYSKGKMCTCTDSTCGGDTECFEELAEHGGVYCKCKKGMVGNGKECFEDKCSAIDCSPGQCVQEKTEVHCECPTGYEADGDSCQQIPMCKRQLDNICGPPERVLECVDIGRTDWTCVCAPGYAVVKTATGRKCEAASNTLFCSNSPCGDVGVKSCQDLSGGGVQCECNDGYLLEKADDGKTFRCSAIDPCKTGPCGSESVAKSCSRTPTGSYYCTCQSTAELVEATETEGSYCRHIEEAADILPYVGAAAIGISLVGIGVGVWWFGFKSGDTTTREYDYTALSFTGPAGQ